MKTSKPQTLSCRAKTAGSKLLHTRLFRDKRGSFGISVRCGAVRASVCAVSENVAEAQAIFQFVLRHGVFPCHLQDVLEDLVTLRE